jgi:hypothetical protein
MMGLSEPILEDAIDVIKSGNWKDRQYNDQKKDRQYNDQSEKTQQSKKDSHKTLRRKLKIEQHVLLYWNNIVYTINTGR